MPFEFSISRVELLKWVDLAMKNFVFTGQFNEIFQCVRFTVKGDSLILEVSDNISYLKAVNSNVDVASKGSVIFLVKAALLHKILLASDKDVINFKVKKNQVEIKTEGVYRIPLLGEEEYPSYVIPSTFSDFELDKSFFEVMDKMLPFVSKDFVRPELAGVSVSEHFYVSSDGQRAVIHLRDEKLLPAVIIPPYFIKVILSIDDFEGLRFAEADSSIWISGRDFYYCCRIPLNEFPYEAVYSILKNKASYRYSAKVSQEEFFSLLNRILVLADARFGQVKLVIAPDLISASYISPTNFLYSHEEVICKSNVETPIEIFGSVSCMSSIRRIFDEAGNRDLVIHFDSPLKPVFLQCTDSDYIFFFMPVREVPVEENR